MANVAVVFPGQGSQYVGMGQAFCQASAEAAKIMTQAEEASGLPIKKLCFEGPMDELTLTVNLQPSVVAVDLICWQALLKKGLEVKAVAGHSLGEYPALVAAGALDNAKCIELAALRGKLMNRDAETNPGAMAAIMGLSPEQVAEITEEIDGVVQPANYNSPAQTVITGLREAVKQASDLAKEKGGKAIPLKVSGAWHSPLMADAKKDMEQAIEQVSFTDPARLLAPNTTGAPTDQADEIKAQLKEQLTSPVRWVQTVNALMDQGIDTFIEAGPKTVLTGLIKKTTKQVRVLNFDTPETLEKVLEAL